MSEGQNLDGMKVEVEGKGTVEDPQESQLQEAVEYDAGAPDVDENTMEGLAEASEQEQGGEVADSGPETADEPQQGEMEALAAEEEMGEKEPDPEPAPTSESIIDESKAIEEPTLTESSRPGFDSSSVQDARYDSEDEGGVARSSSAGKQKNFRGAEEEGAQIKPKPDLDSASAVGLYEVTGFTVSYEPKKGEGTTSVQIRDYFPDMETAMASVNGNKYLMPMPQGGFKIATITQGAPSISFEERQLYEYINGKWRRT